MEGEGLLVELGALDRAGGFLDAEADEVGGGDGLGAYGAGLSVDIGVVIGERVLSVPVAVEGERHVGAQDARQAFGVAGAFVELVGLRVRIDADQPQDRAPWHQLPAEAAEMAGEEIRIAAAGHGKSG